MKLEYLKNVVGLELNREACIGCGLCVEVCPHEVFSIRQAAGGARRAEITDRDSCMECGACAKNCPAGAIKAGSGVGCAVAIIYGLLNKTAPNCDCSGKDGGSCCGG